MQLNFHSYVEDGKRHTEVNIEHGEHKIFAQVSQYFKDRDNRILGQKSAIEKALIDEPSKEMRTLVWDAFYKHSTKTRRLLKA